MQVPHCVKLLAWRQFSEASRPAPLRFLPRFLVGAGIAGVPGAGVDGAGVEGAGVAGADGAGVAGAVNAKAGSSWWHTLSFPSKPVRLCDGRS